MNYDEFCHRVSESPFPPCTVDIIIKIDNSVILIERKYPPYGWALPGGFVEKGESLEAAAVREALEETGLHIDNLKQFHAYSDPRRDPRFHTVTVVFTATSEEEPRAGSDAKKIRRFSFNELPDKMVFDHNNILTDYLKFLNKQPA
ncbi:NUDIX domain-containing protein [Elusimicrobiota bacterium]